MKDAILGYWAERTPREHVLLAILGVLLAGVLVWLLVRPIGPMLKAAGDRHDSAVSALAEAHAQASALKLLRINPPPPLGAPVADFVKQAASETGFQLSRADPVGGDGVVISIVSAKPAVFFGWAASLERRGVFVDQISVRTNPDSTIGVDAQLRARSS